MFHKLEGEQTDEKIELIGNKKINIFNEADKSKWFVDNYLLLCYNILSNVIRKSQNEKRKLFYEYEPKIIAYTINNQSYTYFHKYKNMNIKEII